MLRQLVRTSATVLRRTKNVSSYSKQTRLFSQAKLRSSRNKSVFTIPLQYNKLSSKIYSTSKTETKDNEFVNTTNDTR